MNDYIIQSMALVGCGVSDTKDIAQIVSTLPREAKDVLDTWHNVGTNIPLKSEYQTVADMLKTRFSDDDITCLGAYVNASRNV